MKSVLVACLGLVSCGATDWQDCGDVDVNGLGPYGAPTKLEITWEDKVYYVVHPPLVGSAPFPVMVFSHGSTGCYEMYPYAFERYVSHGFVVVFPHVKSPEEDRKPSTTDMYGDFTLRGVSFAGNFTADPESPLYNMLDMNNLILAGHSMGASATIFAAQRLPAGTAKAAIAQHPGICGPFGPPPCLDPSKPGTALCSTWMPVHFEEANTKMPMVLTTATNDGAFWPAPQTAVHELGCFNKASGADGGLGTAFAQFSSDACAETGEFPDWTDGGHDCPMKHVSPETAWVLVAAKLYAQLGGDLSSKCHAMLWGSDSDSMRADPNVEIPVINVLNNTFTV